MSDDRFFANGQRSVDGKSNTVKHENHSLLDRIITAIFITFICIYVCIVVPHCAVSEVYLAHVAAGTVEQIKK
jgi:hypothetical protein